MAIPKKEMVKRKYHERKNQGLVQVKVWVPAESKQAVKDLERELNKNCKDDLNEKSNGDKHEQKVKGKVMGGWILCQKMHGIY